MRNEKEFPYQTMDLRGQKDYFFQKVTDWKIEKTLKEYNIIFTNYSQFNFILKPLLHITLKLILHVIFFTQ